MSDKQATVDEMVAAAVRIGWPVVAKAVVEGVAHKTEAGFVQTDLRDSDALRKAYAAFGSPATVAVQPFIKGRAEVIVGLTWSKDVDVITRYIPIDYEIVKEKPYAA